MLTGTTFVFDNEPCFRLSEVNLMNPKDGLWHRYQILFVIRFDNLAEYREDLGLAKDFIAPSIFIPGGARENDKIYIEETVGRLKEIADELRSQAKSSFWEVVVNRN